MIKQELYNRTVNILVDAYFNDTLVYGTCYACAVGNIVAANMGYGYHKDENSSSFFRRIFWVQGGEAIRYPGSEKYNFGWGAVSCKSSSEQKNPSLEFYTGHAKTQIDATGYTPHELMKIEIAFESVSKKSDDRMFNGLMAVIDVLDEIHENKDEVVSKATKEKFNKVLIS